MTITATLVHQGHNWLRYLIVSDIEEGDESVDITSTGGPSPDYLTDSLNGPIKNIAKAKADGYGIIPAAGINTDAEARALLLSENAATLVGLRPPTLIARLTPRASSARFTVTAARGPVDQQTASYTVTAFAAGFSAERSCYLDIECPGAIGA